MSNYGKRLLFFFSLCRFSHLCCVYILGSFSDRPSSISPGWSAKKSWHSTILYFRQLIDDVRQLPLHVLPISQRRRAVTTVFDGLVLYSRLAIAFVTNAIGSDIQPFRILVWRYEVPLPSRVPLNLLLDVESKWNRYIRHASKPARPIYLSAWQVEQTRQRANQSFWTVCSNGPCTRQFKDLHI